MKIEKELRQRSGNQCELCGNTDNLSVFLVEPKRTKDVNDSLLACDICVNQINDPEKVQPNHWRCLNDSMWSEHLPVQVTAWRMLFRLKDKGWPQDLLDMMYLDDDSLAWAKAGIEDTDGQIVHKDSNGAILKQGDNVVLIKDLPVKGSSMVAKKGTAVRRISLDRDNAEYIEGKVDGQHIVILTKYVKKT